MRELVFKNLTSSDRKRRVLVCSEFTEQEGVRTNICRHFLCRVCSVKKAEEVLPRPRLYVVKKRNTKQKTETFYCQIKGCTCLMNQNKLFLVDFIHSLRISLKSLSIIANS